MKSTTFATTEMAGVNICSSLSLAFLLPSPVSCFREQRAGVGRENAFPRTRLHNQVKISSPAPASEVSGIVHSVTGYQPHQWVHSGVAFPVLLYLPLYWMCF